MWNNEQEARAQIKSLVCEYYNQFKKSNSTFKKGGHCYEEEERPDVSKWLKLLGDYKQQLADGTIANYDGQSIKMFPKSYKRIPNETYIVCDLCKQDVPLRFIKSHAGKHYCWHCHYHVNNNLCRKHQILFEHFHYMKLMYFQIYPNL